MSEVKEYPPSYNDEKQQQSTSITGNNHKDNNNRQVKLQHHSKGERAIRHAEKRRTGTCAFADRVARASIEKYCDTIPSSFREVQKQTCIATVVAYFKDTDTLIVLALGVGTKFLPVTMLQQDQRLLRVRDCHAEILCKRAFRRYLFQEILISKQKKDAQIQQQHGCCGYEDGLWSILEENKSLDNGNYHPIQYRIKNNVTLHLYCSSAPCGNATLKKFAKMTKETFNETLGPHEWDTSHHGPIHGHSIPLGQFALTVKLDRSISLVKCNNTVVNQNFCSTKYTVATREAKEVEETSCNKNGTSRIRAGTGNTELHPAQMSDDWCPPGTSTVTLGRGSTHTCSDKICRWNILGLQGALLSSFIPEPMYLSSITIARKFSNAICRRALCCRVSTSPSATKKCYSHHMIKSPYRLNHPAIMGTGVYLDNSILEMNPIVVEGENVKFESKLSWAWWSSMGVECLNGANGLLYDYDAEGIDLGRREPYIGCCTTTAGCVDWQDVSELSSASFMKLYKTIQHESLGQCTRSISNLVIDKSQNGIKTGEIVPSGFSLSTLRTLKREVAPLYEHAKDQLLTTHPIFRGWKRREVRDEIYDVHTTMSSLKRN